MRAQCSQQPHARRPQPRCELEIVCLRRVERVGTAPLRGHWATGAHRVGDACTCCCGGRDVARELPPAGCIRAQRPQGEAGQVQARWRPAASAPTAAECEEATHGTYQSPRETEKHQRRPPEPDGVFKVASAFGPRWIMEPGRGIWQAVLKIKP